MSTPLTPKVPIVALALVMATAVSGCAAGAAPVESSARADEALDWSPAEPLWTAEDTVMSEANVVGDVVLTYTASESGLMMTARDAETGDVLWSRPATPGTTATGVRFWPTTTELDGTDVVVYLASFRDDQNGWAQLIVADVRTGTNLAPALVETAIWSARPVNCEDTVCVTAQIDGTQQRSTYMLHDRELVPAEGIDMPFTDDTGYKLGSHIVAHSDNDVQMLAYGEDGEYRWSRPYTDVFGAGTSTAGGWAWLDDDPELPAIGIGYGHEEWDRSVAQTRYMDLTSGRLVALDRDDGDTLWSVDDALDCAPAGDLEVIDDVLVICRLSAGTAVGQWDGSKSTKTTFEGIEDFELVGLDPQTGEELWTLSLDESGANVFGGADDHASFVVGDDPIALVDGEARRVARDTGESLPLPDNASLLCEAERSETVMLSGAWSKGRPETYPRAQPLSICDASGMPTPQEPVSAGSLSVLDASSGGLVVVNTRTGLSAYRVEATTD